MGSIGFDEMLIVAIVAIIAFGKDLPAVMRRVGRWYSKILRQFNDMKEEIARQIPDEDLLDDSPPPSSSARLPGPDPSDPEYDPRPFDPFRPPPEGNGSSTSPSEPVQPSASPDSESPAESRPPLPQPPQR
ncbi:MAG: hypothetical protein HY716_10975 [Planctomycetes bacterium]|nr:hypothetical protein [Planctomycetota bacterium]